MGFEHTPPKRLLPQTRQKRGTKASDPPAEKDRWGVRNVRVLIVPSPHGKTHELSGRPSIQETTTRHKGRHLLSPRHPRKCCRGKSGSNAVERGTPSLTFDIGVRRRLIFDTGSNFSIIKPGVAVSDISATPLKPLA